MFVKMKTKWQNLFIHTDSIVLFSREENHVFLHNWNIIMNKLFSIVVECKNAFCEHTE